MTRLHEFTDKTLALPFDRTEELQHYFIPNATSIPNTTKITCEQAFLIDGKNEGDPSYMCLSDPSMQKEFTKWLARHPKNNLEIREIKLTKKCQHLPCQSPEYPAVTTDIAKIRVSGHSKPASDGHLKTSHLDEAVRPVEWSPKGDGFCDVEPDQDGYECFDHRTVREGLVPAAHSA